MNRTHNWYQNLLVCGFLSLANTPALAQITPDNTLGAESSRLAPNVLINGASSELINGGAQRDSNLFHSFSQFNVGNGQRVYFGNPSGVQNILTRVTGGQASNILGTLGVDGAANLFLINPNGILFGKNASLDVRGSFVGSTANAIQFGNQGIFSIANTEAPPLLTINPSALLFTQIQANAGITNLSQAPAGINPNDQNTTGLRVPDGKSLLLVGGNINLDGGRLRAYGGRVELAGLAALGSVGLNIVGDNFNLSIPNDVARADVTLSNQAVISVFNDGGGDININARNFEISSSFLFAGIVKDLGSDTTQAGDIFIDTTGILTLKDGASIDNTVSGKGNAGNTFIKVRDAVSLVSADIFSNVETGGTGKAGNIDIQAGSLTLRDGAQIQARVNTTSDVGRADAGNININVWGAVDISGTKNGFVSGIFSDLGTGALGNGGNITIKSGSFALSDGAEIRANTAGQGNAGNVFIQSLNQVSFTNALVSSNIAPGGVGEGGDININSGSLKLRNSQLQATIRKSSDTAPAGRGNAGDIMINVRDSVVMDGKTVIFSDVGEGAIGKGGDISITSGSLFLTDGAQLVTGTSGFGDSGNVTIKASEINFQGLEPIGDGKINASGILARVQTGAVGNGGDVTIETETLSISDGAVITAATNGQGNAGNILIQARDSVFLKASIGNQISDNIIDSKISNISTSVLPDGVGEGGRIQIDTESLSITDGAIITSLNSGQGNAGDILINAGSFSMNRSTPSVALSGNITTGTEGQGDAGNIMISARDSMFLDKAIIGSAVLFQNTSFTGKGKGGDIQIAARTLKATNGSQISAFSNAQGDAGNIFINVRETVSVESGSDISTFLVDFPTSTGRRRAGNIEIKANSLFVIDEGNVNSSTNAQGDAGLITINANEQVILDSGETNKLTGISSAVLQDSIGQGGDIEITTGSFSVANGATIVAGTDGKGDAGNININARERFVMSRGAKFFTNTSGQGNAGNVTIQTNNFSIDGVSQAGSRSGIFAVVEPTGIGRAGDTNITANSLSITGGGIINAATFGQGRAGDIKINASQRVFLSDISPNGGFRSAISTETINGATGNAGNITIASPQRITIQDGAGIFASSQGNGQGGNIEAQAGFLTLNRGFISAQTASSNGGNVKFILDNALVLRNGSVISTTAGTALTGGDGGNIDIDTNFIVAVPNENSDITANAFTGKGGNVNVKLQSIFGIEPRSQLTNASDITASSQSGVQGQINITQPEIQPTQELLELPEEVVDASNQIGQMCSRGRNAKPLGEFTITGRGSLPPSPLEPLPGTTSRRPLATLDSSPFANVPRTSELVGTDSPTLRFVTNQTNPTSSAIIEAQGWIKTPDGIYLVNNVSTAIPKASTTPVVCPKS
jgi:filamentous hemagglutinin family protein